MITQFERPADQSDTVKTKRAGYGQKYYDQYAAGAVSNKKNGGTSIPADSDWPIVAG